MFGVILLGYISGFSKCSFKITRTTTPYVYLDLSVTCQRLLSAVGSNAIFIYHCFMLVAESGERGGGTHTISYHTTA